MNYTGDIIEESLEDKGILKELNIVSIRAEKVTDSHQTPWLSQWTLHTIAVGEDQASHLAKKLSKLLDARHGWYIDYRNSLYHYVIFKDKVFKLDRSKKRDYERMIAYGLSVGVPNYQLPNFADLPIDVLDAFLRATRTHAYANENAERAPSLRPKSKDYHFDQGDLGYHDTYFGGTKFIGEEIVYKNGGPAWGMNYYGFTLDDAINESLYDAILRPALMAGSGNTIPVRGPETFVQGDYKYTFSASGTLANFTGVEEIFKKNRIVCRLYCHGGFIES